MIQVKFNQSFSKNTKPASLASIKSLRNVVHREILRFNWKNFRFNYCVFSKNVINLLQTDWIIFKKVPCKRFNVFASV